MTENDARALLQLPDWMTKEDPEFLADLQRFCEKKRRLLKAGAAPESKFKER